MEKPITIALTRDEAVVLFDWLARTSKADEPARFVDQAEQRVLWDLEAALESNLLEPLQSDYRLLVASARDRIRDTDS